MVQGAYLIRAADHADLPAVVDYLWDHVRDNGTPGTPLFQPQPRGAEWPKAEKLAQFRRALTVPVGEPGWRRFWLAFAADGGIAGHADLRGRAELCTPHRALLGTGVHRDHRRRGLGRQLVDVVLAWAAQQPGLAWVDLDVLAENTPARALYLQTGFREVATFPDMFRIDDQQVAQVVMTTPVR